MRVKDVKPGQVFNIDNTPSYPKIRTASGYVDIRDNIVNDTGNCDEKDAGIMPLDGLAHNYDGTVEEVTEWIIKQTGVAPAA